MAYTREQLRIARIFNQAANDVHARPVTRQALIEAGLVESGLRNLSYGDRDSLGALQQRPSQGWMHATNPYLAARDFLSHARQLHQQGFAGGAGALAQAVQRSQFPGRYDQVAGQAARLSGLPGLPGASGGGSGVYGSVTPGRVRGAGFNAGAGDSGAGLASLLAQLERPQQAQPTAQLQDPATSATRYLRTAGGSASSLASSAPAPKPQLDVQALLGALGQDGQGIPGASVTNARSTVTGGVPAPAALTKAKGVKAFDGKPVAGWIAPILAYARQRGWKGTVTSGYRSVAEQARIYNSGQRPAAKPGQSNHNFTAYPGGAIDVTDPQSLARILQNSPYRNVLQWAGAQDPVHFSKHRHGTY